MNQQFIHPHDARLLQEMLDWFRRRRDEPRPQPPEELGQPPEVFVAEAPEDGVPALDLNVTGTGSDDAPGSADCEVYRLLFDGANPYLAPTGITRTVYNLSTDPIDAGTRLIIALDKFGKWWPVGVHGGSSRLILKGKLNGILYGGGYTTMSVWQWNGVYTGTGTDDAEEVDTGEDIEVHAWMLHDNESIAAGSEVIINYIGGRWYVANAACP